MRKEIHDQVCDQGFNAAKGSFTQYYGSDELDASLLMIPLVDFLPAHDPRVRGTIEAVERELVDGGFVLRYRTADTGDVDGLSGREGAFLACSFWLADCLSLLGRDHDARKLLDRLMGLRNDLGLLSEEYDPVAGCLVGNFPQAFSHVSLVNSASKIGGQEKPSPNHVIAGLVKRSMSSGRSAPVGSRHMRSVNARSILSRLVEGADTDPSRRAAHVVKEVIGVQPASLGTPSNRKRQRANGGPPRGPTGQEACRQAGGGEEAGGTEGVRPSGVAVKKTATRKRAVRCRAGPRRCAPSAGAPAAKKRAKKAAAGKSP